MLGGTPCEAPTADLPVHRPETSGLAGFALVFLLLRAFSSGCAALTGVEAISNGVPAFRKPKSKNAATTLLLMGSIAVTMFCGIIAWPCITEVRMAENPATTQLRRRRRRSYRPEDPVIAQVARGGLRRLHARLLRSSPPSPR